MDLVVVKKLSPARREKSVLIFGTLVTEQRTSSNTRTVFARILAFIALPFLQYNVLPEFYSQSFAFIIIMMVLHHHRFDDRIKKVMMTGRVFEDIFDPALVTLVPENTSFQKRPKGTFWRTLFFKNARPEEKHILSLRKKGRAMKARIRANRVFEVFALFFAL
jgi:hypothetical protein